MNLMVAPTKITPRWYQSGSVDAIVEYISRSPGNPCVELPTAAGKSPTMALFIQYVQQQWPGVRVLVLAHVRELIQQNHDKLKEVWPEADAGIYSAGLNRRDTTNSVIFASIQSVKGKALALGAFDFVLVDEAHRIPLAGDGQYRTFIGQVQRINRHARVVGFTATPYRLQGGEVCGAKQILTEIIYRVEIPRLIDDGYLCKPVVKASENHADMASVRTRNGDYVEGDLDDAFSVESLVNASVDEFERLARDRKAWIIFGAGSKHLLALQRAFEERHGIHLPIVTGKTPKAERNRIIDEFKQRKHRGILNINVLSEGFDAPFIDCVGMFRPTKSPGLYYQQVGRGFRLHPSKSDFLVLDFADNVAEHGPVDKLRPPSQKSGGKTPTKVCKVCQTVNLAVARECSECLSIFPPPEERELSVPHATTPNGLEIISTQSNEWAPVGRWEIRRHEKPGKPPSMRVDYHCGLTRVSEWILFEHGSMARARAVQWWTERGGMRPAPRTIDEALHRQSEIKIPREIVAKWRDRYPEVIGYRY